MRLYATALLLLPIIVLCVGGALMSALTDRSRTIARWKLAPDPAERRPINQRIRGYSVSDLEQQWGVLDCVMMANERRFLLLDLAFALLYGTALLTTLLGLRRLGYFTPPASLLMASVGVTVVADWVENLLQLQQLARFRRGAALEASTVAVASVATTLKLVGFVVASILALTGWLASVLQLQW